MLHMALIWLVVAAFAGAGLFNAIGTPSTKSDYVRWGYPAWWCYVTGALEIATARFGNYRGSGIECFAPP
jgi:hypothetical protein